MSRHQPAISLTERVVRLAVYPFVHLFWDPRLSDGSDILPIERPCFIYGNHSHNYDPFIMNIFTRWGEATTGVLTQDYFRGGIEARMMKDINLLPTRKHIPDPHLIRKIYKKVDNGEAIVIYPEGGRRWDGRPLPWIESTAKIFIKSGIPIYPVVTHASYVSWPRWARYPRPGRMRIQVLDPFVFDRKAPFQEALDRLKAPIDFDETIVPDELKPRWAFRPASGIHRLLYRDPETGDNGGIYTPDGTHVVNKAGTIRYKMLPDSLLLDEKTGQLLTTAELYDRVQALPLQKNERGALAEANVELHSEVTFPDLVSHGAVQARFFEDAIQFSGSELKWTVPLEDIQNVGIERSSKLQLFQAGRMIQCTFPFESSALHWHDLFFRLTRADVPHENSNPPVSS